MNFPLFLGWIPPRAGPWPRCLPLTLCGPLRPARCTVHETTPPVTSLCATLDVPLPSGGREDRKRHTVVGGGVLSPSAHLLGSLSTSADQGVRGCGCVCVCVKAGLGRSTGYLLKLRLAHGLTGLCAIFSVSCVSVTIKIHLKVILPWGGFSVEMKGGETYPKKSHRA